MLDLLQTAAQGCCADDRDSDVFGLQGYLDACNRVHAVGEVLKVIETVQIHVFRFGSARGHKQVGAAIECSRRAQARLVTGGVSMQGCGRACQSAKMGVSLLRDLS